MHREPPIHFRPADHREIDLLEPSDVVALQDERLLVVSDTDAAALLLAPHAAPRRVLLHSTDEASGFEAVAYDPARAWLFVAAEEARVIRRYRYAPAADTPPTLEATVDTDLAFARATTATEKKTKKKNKKKKNKKDDQGSNKGIEGMAFLPARFSPTGSAGLLVAKEARPRMLVLLSDSGEGEGIPFELDPRLEEACQDFSGLALDGASGQLFVCSDESASLAQVALGRSGAALQATLVHATPLRDDRGRELERVEGVAIDDRGVLWVLLEDARELVRFTRA